MYLKNLSLMIDFVVWPWYLAEGLPEGQNLGCTCYNQPLTYLFLGLICRGLGHSA